MKTDFGVKHWAFVSQNEWSIQDKNEINASEINEKFLQAYVLESREKAIKDYLENSDVDIDVNYKEGLFLIKAAQAGDVKALELLIEKGANVGLVEALSYAADYKHMDCVEFLLRKGVDPNALKGTETYRNHHKYMEAFLTSLAPAAPSVNIIDSKQSLA